MMGATPNMECRWCGMHHGPLCPAVKAIEYHPDGTAKRVEFRDPVPQPSPGRMVVDPNFCVCRTMAARGEPPPN